MAHRRMFSLAIVDTDRFLEMPSSTQALYFHLGMRADDDGFVAAPKSIAAICNCSVDDIRLLAAKGFVKAFETGVLVITDWKENNKIRKDRYTPTKFTHEKSLLGDNQNDNQSDNQTATEWLPQDRLGKVRIGKVSNTLHLVRHRVNHIIPNLEAVFRHNETSYVCFCVLLLYSCIFMQKPCACDIMRICRQYFWEWSEVV